MIHRLKQFLDRYDLTYTEKRESLVIKLPFSLQIHINILSNNQVRLTTRLANWNLLTGALEMKLSSAMIYNTVGVIVITLLFFFLPTTAQDLSWVYIFLGAITWVLIWTIYYTVTAATMHQQIRTWLDQEGASV
ncbi:MAG: hypothetical protein KGY75_07720 [Candidatus Cloacimonetes bacterium]|nr:hypothetical protein [Candidatus Cloacimonadota bacterium]